MIILAMACCIVYLAFSTTANIRGLHHDRQRSQTFLCFWCAGRVWYCICIFTLRFKQYSRVTNADNWQSLYRDLLRLLVRSYVPYPIIVRHFVQWSNDSMIHLGSWHRNDPISKKRLCDHGTIWKMIYLFLRKISVWGVCILPEVLLYSTQITL